MSRASSTRPPNASAATGFAPTASCPRAAPNGSMARPSTRAVGGRTGPTGSQTTPANRPRPPAAPAKEPGSKATSPRRAAGGKFGGSLAKTPASELGAIVIRAALARARLASDQIGEVIMGQVLAAGVGQNPARQAAMKAGVAKETPALTINAVCGSGLKSVMLAAQAVAWGDSQIVVAGGQESMSLAPHLLNGSRDGQRMGDWKLIDSMITDGLWDVYHQYHMGVTAENVAKAHRINRQIQ